MNSSLQIPIACSGSSSLRSAVSKIEFKCIASARAAQSARETRLWVLLSRPIARQKAPSVSLRSVIPSAKRSLTASAATASHSRGKSHSRPRRDSRLVPNALHSGVCIRFTTASAPASPCRNAIIAEASKTKFICGFLAVCLRVYVLENLRPKSAQTRTCPRMLVSAFWESVELRSVAWDLSISSSSTRIPITIAATAFRSTSCSHAAG